MTSPLCIVCNNPAPALYGGLDDMPICWTCYDNGALAQWLHDHPERDPDAQKPSPPGPVLVVEASADIVGNEQDGPLEACIPAYRMGARPAPGATQNAIPKNDLDRVIDDLFRGKW